MKKIAIVLIGIALVAGVGIWWYNSSKDNQENQGTTYQAERSSTNMNVDKDTTENNTTNNHTNTNTSTNTNTNSNSNTNANDKINTNANTSTQELTPKAEIEIARFSTKIYNKDKERQNNIGITCKALTSIEIKPGETFSFCNTVGKSTSSKGYQEADIYVDGKKEQGLGGGNCQVSTTLYNAVLQVPGLEVVERHQHSGHVPYVGEGKDAAVAYGAYDFKFKNNTQNTIKIMMENSAENVTAILLKK